MKAIRNAFAGAILALALPATAASAQMQPLADPALETRYMGIASDFDGRLGGRE